MDFCFVLEVWNHVPIIFGGGGISIHFYQLVKGAFINGFFFLPKGAIWLAHHKYFGNKGHSPNIKA
jgi:hypothetical protein